MDYEIKEVELRNNSITKKRRIIQFADEQYEILAEFLMSDAPLMDWQIVRQVENVINGNATSIKSSGNRTHIHVTLEETVLTDLLSSIEKDFSALQPLRIKTENLYSLLQRWYTLNTEHSDNNG